MVMWYEKPPLWVTVQFRFNISTINSSPLRVCFIGAVDISRWCLTLFLGGCFFFNLYSPELPCNDLSSPQHTNTNIKGIVLIIWEELWSIIIWGLTRLKQIPWATLHYKTAKKVTGHLPLFDDTGNAFVRCHVFLRLLPTIPSLNTFYGYYLASLGLQYRCPTTTFKISMRSVL